MDIYANKIFLNIQGTPTKQNLMCLSHGHGYYAYVSVKDAFINTFFKDICMWSGFTNTYKTKEGFYYNQFELDCRDKAFFKSESFKTICKKHNVELIIFDDGDDNQIVRDFWEQMDTNS